MSRGRDGEGRPLTGDEGEGVAGAAVQESEASWAHGLCPRFPRRLHAIC